MFGQILRILSGGVISTGRDSELSRMRKKALRNEPAVGEKWELMPNDGDPFPRKEGKYGIATILDVREGWVRYDLGSPFRDNRMSMSSFLNCYRRAP